MLYTEEACSHILHNICGVLRVQPKTSVCDIQCYAVLSLLDAYFGYEMVPGLAH